MVVESYNHVEITVKEENSFVVSFQRSACLAWVEKGSIKHQKLSRHVTLLEFDSHHQVSITWDRVLEYIHLLV